jgi:SAM-dependent methyltransferase
MSADYFANHRLKLRFPWRMYHTPIVEAFAEVLQRSGPRVLNVGSGPFFELERLPRAGKAFTACDVDARAIDLARSLHGRALSGADVVDPEKPLPYADGTFDVVAAMDVVEHVVPAAAWVADAWRVVAPGGTLFLTTPNYGSRSLDLIEKTVLEAVARAQGFSRKTIHPTKLDERSLSALLEPLRRRASTSIRRISHGWVLTAVVRKEDADGAG